MKEAEEARRALLNIQEEIRRDLVKEKELQEARHILKQKPLTVNNPYNCSSFLPLYFTWNGVDFQPELSAFITESSKGFYLENCGRGLSAKSQDGLATILAFVDTNCEHGKLTWRQ